MNGREFVGRTEELAAIAACVGEAAAGPGHALRGRSPAALHTELHLVGVAVAAPAVELGALLRDDVGDFLGVRLGAYAFAAYRQVYGPTVKLTTVLTPAGAAATPAIATTCAYVASLCGHHERVDDDTMKDASHLLVGFKARPQVRKFFSDLLAGRPVTTTCN